MQIDKLLRRAFSGIAAAGAILAAAAVPTSTLAEQPERRADLIRLLVLLNDSLEHGADDVQELISVSFVENLIGEDAALETLRPLMKPALKKEVDDICE